MLRGLPTAFLVAVIGLVGLVTIDWLGYKFLGLPRLTPGEAYYYFFGVAFGAWVVTAR